MKCSKCKKDKDEEEFRLRYKSKRRLSHCNDCQREYMRKHYQKNKAVYVRKARKRNDRNGNKVRVFLLEYLLAHPCVDCGEKDVRVLQFDHVKGNKVSEISSMLCAGCVLETIVREIEKCEVRCANCHLRRTADQFGYWRSAALERRELLEGAIRALDSLLDGK